MTNPIVRLRRNAHYFLAQKKLERLGFFRRHYDSNGNKLSSVTPGVVMFSEKKNSSGDVLAILVTHQNYSNILTLRVTGYDPDNEKIVDTPEDGMHHVDSVNEIAVIAAGAMRSFVNNESVSYDGDSKQVSIRERKLFQYSRKTEQGMFK